MKKKYIKPETKVVKIAMTRIMCASKVGMSNGSQHNNVALTRGGGGWDDDFEDE